LTEEVPVNILTISKRAPEYHRVHIDFLDSNPLMSASYFLRSGWSWKNRIDLAL